LTFIVRIFVDDTIAITVWTSFYFHACSCAHPWYGLAELSRGSHEPDCFSAYAPDSFTEGSKSVGHLPRYLSIQRDPQFFSAYHH
jgi:hypothetical protein